MKRIYGLILSIMCCLLLSACGMSETDADSNVQVYYLNTEETKVEMHGQKIVGVSLEEQLDELLQYLATNPEKLEYKAPLAMGVQVLGMTLVGDRVALDVSSEYLELPVTTEVLVRAAIVRTLTQLEEVDYVSLTVEGNQLFDSMGNIVGLMNAEQFIDNNGSDINTYEPVRIKLYFATEEGNELVVAYREKHYSTNTPMERFVLDELIQGPSGQVPGLYPTVNPATNVVNVMTKDGICYVNLDEDFLTVVNNVSIETAIYSITNSLAELSNINKVQILINGEVPANIANTYYERNLDIVTSLN